MVRALERSYQLASQGVPLNSREGNTASDGCGALAPLCLSSLYFDLFDQRAALKNAPGDVDRQGLLQHSVLEARASLIDCGDQQAAVEFRRRHLYETPCDARQKSRYVENNFLWCFVPLWSGTDYDLLDVAAKFKG